MNDRSEPPLTICARASERTSTYMCVCRAAVYVYAVCMCVRARVPVPRLTLVLVKEKFDLELFLLKGPTGDVCVRVCMLLL